MQLKEVDSCHFSPVTITGADLSSLANRIIQLKFLLYLSKHKLLCRIFSVIFFSRSLNSSVFFYEFSSAGRKRTVLEIKYVCEVGALSNS